MTLAKLCVSGVMMASATVKAAPTFADYPVVENKVKPATTVKLQSKQDRLFRTQLARAARQPANFAGHFVLANIGCGASCLLTAAIDRNSGRVSWLPYSICCWEEPVTEPVRYRRDSALLILEGRRNEEDYGTWYWKLSARGFEQIPGTRLTRQGPADSGKKNGSKRSHFFFNANAVATAA
ncbi:MAG: hypothetical protein ACLGI6_01515 [Gammaproteobacteria bacterium]